VDRASLKSTNSVPDVEPDVRTQLGEPVTVSADGRYALYDLHAFAAEAELSQGADALKALATRVLAGS
jgi:hypothetical protein